MSLLALPTLLVLSLADLLLLLVSVAWVLPAHARAGAVGAFGALLGLSGSAAALLSDGGLMWWVSSGGRFDSPAEAGGAVVYLLAQLAPPLGHALALGAATLSAGMLAARIRGSNLANTPPKRVG